jgi:hypothetical protein
VYAQVEPYGRDDALTGGGLIDRFGPERTRREGMYRTRAATCMDGTWPRFPAFTDTRGIGPSRPSGSCTRASGLVNVCELPSHASNELRPVFAGIEHKQQWGRTCCTAPTHDLFPQLTRPLRTSKKRGPLTAKPSHVHAVLVPSSQDAPWICCTRLLPRRWVGLVCCLRGVASRIRR